jgi:prolyl-tRNA synthetase
VGVKTRRERFAGAINTMACEAMMRDGKALQMGTSHELGQNFSRAFDITYLDDGGQLQHCWTTSWGSSTRMIGGLIMAHGDDDGLRVPPNVAHVQVVVCVVRDGDGVIPAAARLRDALVAAGVRARLDDRVGTSFGRRVTDWELKGVPVRVEVGPRDLAKDEVTLVRRDDASKVQVSVGAVAGAVRSALDAAQAALLAEALGWRDARTVEVATIADAVAASNEGFARIPWRLLGEEGEEELARSSVTVRCLQLPDGTVPEGVDDPELDALVARAY